jgi:hypothetical protein
MTRRPTRCTFFLHTGNFVHVVVPDRVEMHVLPRAPANTLASVPSRS